MGDVVVFRVRLGLSSAMFSSAMMLVGMQVIMFGISAAIVNRRMGWTEADRLSGWLQKHFSLERGLVGGLLILLIGVVTGLTARRDGFRSPRHGVGNRCPAHANSDHAVFLALFGLQVVFGTFYLSFLDVGRTLK